MRAAGGRELQACEEMEKKGFENNRSKTYKGMMDHYSDPTQFLLVGGLPNDKLLPSTGHHP